jgi:hypothetical protein
MNLIIVSVISIIFFVLLFGLAFVLIKKIRNNSIQKKTAIALGFVGSLLVLVLFVLLMGLLKNIQN